MSKQFWHINSKFCHRLKSVHNDVTYEENFPTSKILVRLVLFNTANLCCEKFCKKEVGIIWPKSSKTPVKDKTPVKLQAWHFTSKASLYG